MAWNDPDGNERDPGASAATNKARPTSTKSSARCRTSSAACSAERGGGGESNGSGGGDSAVVWGFAGLLLAAFLVWEMVYRIGPAEAGVVMRFGKYVTTLQPGPHIRLPRPFEEVVKVNIERIRP